MQEQDKFYTRKSLQVARVLLVVNTPAISISLYRVLSEDGAWRVLVLQGILYVILLIASFSTKFINYRQRFVLLAFIAAMVGVGSALRNQDSLPLYLFWLLSTLLTAPLLKGRRVYILLISGYIAALAASQILAFGTPAKELTRFIATSGMGVVTLFIVYEHMLFLKRNQKENRDLAQQLENQLEKQREMFAVIGHELRTPVAAISMVGRDADFDAVSAREQIVEISENLLAVLEDLRVVVAPERALETKNQERCDPVRTINRALHPLSQLMKQNSVELRLSINKPEGTEFLLHAQPLRQVVTNLTKNATIHSGGGVVQVSFDYETDADGTTFGSLIVEDDGRGIPETLREQVFEPFSRGDTESEGSGLGLFIVKEIAELMDGTLDYSTSELGGACFTLTFPMKPIEVEERSKASAVSLKGLRILLAEDDAMLRMLTEKSLGKLGAQIASYDNGQKALAAFEADQFDLVLTDLMMPMMNGHELTKSLRDLGAKIPIIGVTAAVIGDETDEWLKDGANAFISKPITPEKLQNALDTIGFTPADAT